MKKRLIFTFQILFFAAFTLAGCATLLGPKTHPLSVSSDPGGAEVYVNGFKMGTTPVQLDLKADKSYTIEFRKEGYETVTRIVNAKVGAGWVILDVVTGLIPVIIDASTGAWNTLDQDAVNAALVEQNK